MKRLLDLVIVFIVSPILIVVYPIIALTILLMDGRPILFAQNRSGKDSKIFLMYKFRTMDPSSGEALHE